MNVESLAKWSKPIEVRTRFGRRILRKASPTEAFWNAWQHQKGELKSLGLQPVKTPIGIWEVCWWMPVPEAQKEAEKATIASSSATTSSLSIPAPTSLEYLPFQRAGIEFMSKRPSTLLADEMGLGKTIQAIGLINLIPEIQKVLVVCPASLKINWRNELRKWLVRPLTVGIQYGNQRWDENPCDIRILNYDILNRFPEIYRTVWDLLIADEAHYLKNWKAKRTQLLIGKPGVRAHRKIFMTGTPILNRPVEVFPLLYALEPGKWTFQDKIRYCNGTQGHRGWDFSGAAYLEEFQERLRSSILCRRLKQDVLPELPAKRRQIVELPANGDAEIVREEKENYIRHEVKLALLKAEAEALRFQDNQTAYLQAVKELHEAELVALSEIAKLRHEVARKKIPHVVGFVKEVLEEQERVVVFGHHLDVIDDLKNQLQDYHPATITGQTQPDQRQGIVDQFNQGHHRVLILGIRAAGTGLSLKANHEIFAELDWTPGVVQQAEDRCHGVGRGIDGEPLLIQHLVLEDSLDSNVVKTLVEKQEIIDKALNRSSAPPDPSPLSPFAKEIQQRIHQALSLRSGLQNQNKPQTI